MVTKRPIVGVVNLSLVLIERHEISLGFLLEVIDLRIRWFEICLGRLLIETSLESKDMATEPGTKRMVVVPRHRYQNATLLLASFTVVESLHVLFDDALSQLKATHVPDRSELTHYELAEYVGELPRSLTRIVASLGLHDVV